MKSLKHRIWVRLAVVVTAFALSSSLASAATFLFNVNLDGSQENPAVPTAGTGFGTVTYDDGAGTISVNISFTNLGSLSTISHIHQGAFGSPPGPVIVDFTSVTPSGTSGTIIGTAAMPGAQVANLMAGLTYYNIHSQNFGGGEIRGQLVPVPEPGTLALGGLGLAFVAAHAWRRRRRNIA